jgi:hypothetical protein
MTRLTGAPAEAESRDDGNDQARYVLLLAPRRGDALRDGDLTGSQRAASNTMPAGGLERLIEPVDLAILGGRR